MNKKAADALTPRLRKLRYFPGYQPVYTIVVLPVESTEQTAVYEPFILEVPVKDAVFPLALVTVYEPLLSDAILLGIV